MTAQQETIVAQAREIERLKNVLARIEQLDFDCIPDCRGGDCAGFPCGASKIAAEALGNEWVDTSNHA